MSASLPATTPANPTKPPRKRLRWTRYSLRALLVVITVFGVWLGIKVDQARRQKRAVETLRALGAEVAYEHQRVKNGFDMKIELGVPMWARERAATISFRPFDWSPFGRSGTTRALKRFRTKLQMTT
jgi:hypothetical protein